MPKTEKGVVWCDASSIAIGTCVEIGSTITENAAWLRKRNDFNYTNVSELDVVLKGINAALKWGLTEVEIKTYSVTVLSRSTL